MVTWKISLNFVRYLNNRFLLTIAFVTVYIKMTYCLRPDLCRFRPQMKMFLDYEYRTDVLVSLSPLFPSRSSANNSAKAATKQKNQHVFLFSQICSLYIVNSR